MEIMNNDISNIDKNFQVKSSFDEKDIKLFDVRSKPFKVYGLYNYKTEKVFKRMPDLVGQSVSEGVAHLYSNTAGGRVRFTTNSKYIAIKAIMPSICRLAYMPLLATSGFDLYVNINGKDIFYNSFCPPAGMQDGYESIIHFNDNKTREITINFPLYNDLDDLYIGLQAESDLKERCEYKYIKPVLYYGSSITQGGCASRPGNSYQPIISRSLDCDYINLGFSGNAKGEDTIVDYMSNLDFSVFVCDYDHNAPSVEHLSKTHSKLYKKIREKNKEVPIILIPRPSFDGNSLDTIQRRDIIYKTYIEAINNDDENIYFIDGQSLFQGEGRDDCTVDGVHPNDIGFRRMADIIGSVIQKVIS